ncbi:helix-turn-helix transcriptional regulator [Achromobacter xylosoxidans]
MGERAYQALQRHETHPTGEPKRRRQKRLLLPDRLLPGALYSWTEIETFVRVSRETWRIRVMDGTAPPKVKTGERGVKYRGAEVLRWIDDPAGYQAPKARS